MRAHRSVGALAVLLPALLAAAVPAPGADPQRGTSVSSPAPEAAATAGPVAADAVATRATTSVVRRAARSVTGARTEPAAPKRVKATAPAPMPTPITTPTPTPTPAPDAVTEPAPVVDPAPAPVAPAPAAPAAPAPTEGVAPTPEPAPSDAPGTTVRRTVPLGVTIPWGPLDPARLAATTASVGTAPRYLQWYTGFGEAVDVTKLQAVTDAGAVPVVTWEPWVWTDGVTQPRFAMSTVVAGHHDAYLAAWADALAAWDRPVMLRFAHEMNGSWYPWAAGVNGNTAADHVAAWRHVHDLFAARGADRVQWVWAPNVVFAGSTPLAGLYPGDAYVDVLGLDGYNWGTSVAWETWKSPAQVLDPTVAELRRLAPTKPLLVTETASTELGGDKAAWVTDLFGWAAAQPDLLGVLWFDENKETDWRIASSAASAAAFREAVTP